MWLITLIKNNSVEDNAVNYLDKNNIVEDNAVNYLDKWLICSKTPKFNDRNNPKFF